MFSIIFYYTNFWENNKIVLENFFEVKESRFSYNKDQLKLLYVLGKKSKKVKLRFKLL